MDSALLEEGKNVVLETTEVVCPICGSATHHAFAKARSQWAELQREYSIVRCDECGGRYLNPRLTNESLTAAYNVIQTLLPPSSAHDSTKGSALTQWWRHYGSYQVADAVTAGPVLDLGCNQGELLEELRDKGLEARGVEFSAEAVQWCRNRGLDVVQENLDELEMERGRYKTVILSHVLEHLSNPVDLLSRIAQQLGTGGRVVICVPNVDSPTRFIFGASWHGWDPPFHLVHYDEETLRATCARAGLTVTRTVKRMIPEDVRRSLLLWQGRSGRHLLLRGLMIPALAVLTMLGFGSYLLVTATVDSKS